MLWDKAKILKNAKNWTCEGPHRMELWRRWLLRNQIEGREKGFRAYLFRYSCQQFRDLRCERMSLSVLGAELHGKKMNQNSILGPILPKFRFFIFFRNQKSETVTTMAFKELYTILINNVSSWAQNLKEMILYWSISFSKWRAVIK